LIYLDGVMPFNPMQNPQIQHVIKLKALSVSINYNPLSIKRHIPQPM